MLVKLYLKIATNLHILYNSTMKLLLAPMATLSHQALRNLIYRFGGCDEYYCEMIHATSLVSGGKFEEYYIKTLPEPDKMVWQLTDYREDAIEKAGITLGKNDRLSVDKTENVTHGMEITIERGVSIKVTVAGKAKNYVTTEKTVAHALKQLKIKYDKDDIVEPSKSAKIKRGMKITVKKVEVKQETEEKVIPFVTKTEYSASMEKGQSKVKQAGVNGKKTVVSKNTYIDGELTSSEVIEEKVITDAVNKIVVYGSKVTTTAAPTTKAPAVTKAPAATKAPTTKAPTTAGKHIVSKERVEDCDGSGHGYYVITYSDGSVVYQDF